MNNLFNWVLMIDVRETNKFIDHVTYYITSRRPDRTLLVSSAKLIYDCMVNYSGKYLYG